jgi:large subunit ribosomal protein L35
MPKLKLKTHKGASKRFKKTGSGKIMRHHSGARHILTSKSPGRKRKLSRATPLDDTNMNAVKDMLPY